MYDINKHDNINKNTLGILSFHWGQYKSEHLSFFFSIN